jgi:hypothetical protein
MLSLIPSTISYTTNATNNNNNVCDMNQTFAAKGRISGLVYTSAESRATPPHMRPKAPDMLLGTWNWKVEKGMTISPTDFNASISMVSTLASDNQTIEILNLKTTIPARFCHNYVQVRGTADIIHQKNDIPHIQVYKNTNITVEPHGEQNQALKTIKITIEGLINDPLSLRQKPIYGIVDYYSTGHNKNESN